MELSLSDDVDNVMQLQLMVATKEMADDLAQRFRDNPEQIYSQMVPVSQWSAHLPLQR